MKRFLAAAVLALLVAAPARAVEVTANDLADTYDISGAVILDPSFPEAREAAGCRDCHWHVVRTCASGTLEDRSGCLGTPCLRAADIAQVWRADAPTAPPLDDPAWTFRGIACLPENPVPTAAVAPAVLDTATRLVPPIAAASQPTGSTLTGLRTYFRTGQPASLVTAPAQIAGASVVVRATPTWTWDFGHGAVLTTADPGGPYPTGRVTHTYPRRGTFRVRVTCTWHAVYEVRGITDIPVDGVITQSAWFDLRVREGRAYLRTQGA